MSQEVPNKLINLSIEECRRLLQEEGTDLSDKQIEELRDALYAVIENLVANYFVSSNIVDEHVVK